MRLLRCLLLVGGLGWGASPAAAVVGPSHPGAALGDGIVMVLSRHGREAGFCTGVVLTPNVVMTAAHCVPPGADVRVHFPAPGQAPVLLPVRDVVRHPGYRADAIRTRQRSIDLALVRLPAPLPPPFRPLPLAQQGGRDGPGQRFTLMGYGLGREGDPASSGQLRSADLEVRPPASDVLLWAGDSDHTGAGACTGDSGAPVIRNGESTVAALTVWSSGTGTRQCGDLTQALWLAPLRPWIAGALQRWEPGR